jgi:acyl-coenzyme A thioesterase PaaI-like protein
MSENERIRAQVLRAIAANREPGFHFAGNLLDLSFDKVEPQDTRLSLDGAPHLADADGEVNVGAVAMLADLGLAGCMRATLEPHQRLATVSMTLEFTALPRTGRLEARSGFAGFAREGRGRVGKAEVRIANERGTVCVGIGAFMALDPPADVKLHPVPHRNRRSAPVRPLPESELTESEAEILRRADDAIRHPKPSFIERFWGLATGSMENGPHVGNRVGHAQGGVLLGLAASTACRALPASWRLSSICGWYLRPGQGSPLVAATRILHQGRLTAVARTPVTDPHGRTVIDVTTTHAHA